MSAKSMHLVCYDIRDDRRLRQVAKLLEGYGQRVQFSIFRCRLTAAEVERLRWELTRITESVDSWMIVPLCRACVQRLRRRGKNLGWSDEPPDHLVL